MYHQFDVGRGYKLCEDWTINGGGIGGSFAKSGKNTNLLVIIRVRLWHKIGLHNLMNRN